MCVDFSFMLLLNVGGVFLQDDAINYVHFTFAIAPRYAMSYLVQYDNHDITSIDCTQFSYFVKSKNLNLTIQA